MRRLGLALAFVLTAACSDGGPATAPDLDAGDDFELIEAGEIVDAAFLDDLSDEDRAAIREALRSAAEEIRGILARYRAGEIDRAGARELIEGVHLGLIETLSGFLTEDQIERLLRGRFGDDRPDLDLTDEQRRQLAALREECRERVRRVIQAVREGDLTAREGRRRVREIAHACRREACGILDETQRERVPFCRGDDAPG
jgi:DNA-binding MarR family transcriptional regulator